MRRSREGQARIDSIEDALAVVGRVRAELETVQTANGIEQQRMGRTAMSDSVAHHARLGIAYCGTLREAVCRLTQYEYAKEPTEVLQFVVREEVV